MANEAGGSVSYGIGPPRRGDHAAQPIGGRYCERLARLARGNLAGGGNLAADEGDLEPSAFDRIRRIIAAGRSPVLDDRDDLRWRPRSRTSAASSSIARFHPIS